MSIMRRRAKEGTNRHKTRQAHASWRPRMQVAGVLSKGLWGEIHIRW
jgi:hypothetical protein